MPLGGLITLAVLLPNLIYLIKPPRFVPPEEFRKNSLFRTMEIIERIGQAASFLIPFFYQIPALRGASLDALVFMALALGFYYAGWVRYAIKGHRFSLLFAPMLGVPLPMAISPVIYFLAAAVFLRSWPLGIAALLLGVGHVFVSQGEWERCKLAKMYQPS